MKAAKASKDEITAAVITNTYTPTLSDSSRSDIDPLCISILSLPPDEGRGYDNSLMLLMCQH